MTAIRTTPRRWPLVLIAAPAAVAVWSGWVGLGTLCGFGVIHPLPGIWNALRLNTAITLPVGVEAYGAYALGAWLAPVAVPKAARRFAKRSAIGALALGMLGQVVYHLLAADHAQRAPWPVVVLVSCLPVITLGFGAALTHLLRLAAVDQDTTPETDPAGMVPAAETSTSAGDLAPVPVPVPADVVEAAKASLRATIAAGNPLSQNQLAERFGLTRAQATKVRQAVTAEANGHPSE